MNAPLTETIGTTCIRTYVLLDKNYGVHQVTNRRVHEKGGVDNAETGSLSPPFPTTEDLVRLSNTQATATKVPVQMDAGNEARVRKNPNASSIMSTSATLAAGEGNL